MNFMQMLLSQKLQEIGSDTCKNCCLLNIACACRQQFGFSHGMSGSSYYLQEQDQSGAPGNVGNVYVTGIPQGEVSTMSRPVRVHVRGPVDGLAGIGRGQFIPAAAWPPTQLVYSRVPFSVGNRNCQQSPANDDSGARADQNGDSSGGDGLTALVGLTQSGSNLANGLGDQAGRAYETDFQNRFSGTSLAGTSSSSIPVQMLEHPDHASGMEWENASGSSISLDMKTPLSHFPPFRFG